MVALKWSMGNFFGVKPGEVFWAASDVGWVVGHSYIVYGPLLHGCTAVLYEGKPVGTPDAGAYWRVIADHGVVTLFTAPTAFRAIKKEDPEAELLQDIRSLLVPRPVPRRRAGRSRYGEMGRGHPAGARHRPLVADGDRLAGGRQPAGTRGAPRQARLAHGGDAGLYPRGAGRRRQACRSQHHGRHRHQAAAAARRRCRPSGRRTSGSRNPTSRSIPATTTPRMRAIIDEDGYIWVMGRTDDIINVAGHRLSTGGMEEVLASHPAVAECAVIGVKDSLKGEVPCGFVVLKSGIDRPPEEIEAELVGPGARQDRARGRLQAGDHGGAPAQDPLRQDPARHHEEDRRWRCVDDARHHRRSDGPERDRRCASGEGACRSARSSLSRGIGVGRRFYPTARFRWQECPGDPNSPAQPR